MDRNALRYVTHSCVCGFGFLRPFKVVVVVRRSMPCPNKRSGNRSAGDSDDEEYTSDCGKGRGILEECEIG